MHPIQHIGNVPFGKEGKQTYIKNILHVPTITKKLVSVSRIVEQGKYDSTKAVAISKKRADSSHTDEERAECSFSIRTK